MKMLKPLAALFFVLSVSSAVADSPLGGYTSEVAGLYNKKADSDGLKTHLHLDGCKNGNVVLCKYSGESGVSISAFSVLDKNDLNFLMVNFHGDKEDILNLILTLSNIIKTYEPEATDHDIVGVIDEIGDGIQSHNTTKDLVLHHLKISVANNDSFGLMIGFAQN